MWEKKTFTKSQCLCHTIATWLGEVRGTQHPNWSLRPKMVESPWHYVQHRSSALYTQWGRESVCVFFPVEATLGLLVMQCYNMSRWCYFSSHFTLGQKGSAAIVTLARVAWHKLKWPLALSFTSLSHSNSLCYSQHTVHLLNSSHCLLCLYLLCPSLSPSLPPSLFPAYPSPPLLNLTPFHPVISPSPPHSPRGHPCSLWALIIIASDQDGDSISGILQ